MTVESVMMSINMNLQEHIKKVLKEELNESTYFRRRVDMSSLDKKFFTNLNIVTDKYLKRHDGYCSFNVFRTTVISYLIDDYRDNLSDEDYDNFPYDEVYNFLFNLFYDKIKDRYVEVFGGDIDESENIRKVLREETEVIPSFILRRIGGYVNNILLAYGNHNLKGNFKNLIDEISDVIINDLLSDYIDSIGYTVDDEDDNYNQSVVDKVYDKYYNLLAEHIQGNYSDEIYKLYRKNKK